MNKECGELLLTAPKTYSWKIGSKNSAGIWISEAFFIPGYLKSSRFLIQPLKQDPESSILYLYEMSNGASKMYDLSIALKYDHQNITIFGEYAKSVYSSGCFWYNLARIKINNLLEITVSFSRAETSDSKVEERDEKESVDKTGESSKKRKHEQESSVVEENKRINTRGLDALSGNLKDAFLSAEDTDVVIKVGDQEYRAHKVILKNRSPVFYSMLKYDMVEKNEGIVDISDCDPDIFRDFLIYLYTGKVDSMSKGNVFELYYISDKYGVELLKLDCVDFILNNLDRDIICDVIALATRHLEREVLKYAISFFTDNAKEIFLTSNWQKFIKEYPIQANELIIKAFNRKY